MDCSEFFETYFTYWIITLPLTFYFVFFILRTLIHFVDYLINYKRIKQIKNEVWEFNLNQVKENLDSNSKVIDHDTKDYDILKTLLHDHHKPALGSEIYNEIRQLIRKRNVFNGNR